MGRLHSNETSSYVVGDAMVEAPLRVLLVEDNPGDVLIVQQVLSGQGAPRYLIDHVPRLDAAMEKLRESRYDLVLLDLSLPDGYGSFTIECAATFAKDLPVIVLTGIDDDRLALSAIQAGAEDYFLKSKIQGDLLSSMIDRVIERRRRMDRLQEFVRKRGKAENDGLHDPATGLLAGPLFRDRLEHTIAQSERAGRSFAVITLRINEYQAVEHSGGQSVAAQMMRSAADCLSTRVRRSDTLARISPDSFGVLLDGMSERSSIHSTIGALVISLSNIVVSAQGGVGSRDLTASIGVSVFPKDGHDVEVLLSHALQFRFATCHFGADSIETPVAH